LPATEAREENVDDPHDLDRDRRVERELADRAPKDGLRHAPPSFHLAGVVLALGAVYWLVQDSDRRTDKAAARRELR
jgi:hypothetical protein